jgi:hypothetical protein
LRRRTCTPLRDQQTPSGPKGPRRKWARRSRWQQSAHWMQWVEKGPAAYETRAPRPLRYGRRAQQRSIPPRTRFARARVPWVLYSLLSKSVAAVSRFRSGDPRLISRDAKKAEPSAAERTASRPTGRLGTTVAAVLMAGAGVLFAGRSAGPSGPDGLADPSDRVGPEPTISSRPKSRTGLSSSR